MKKLSTANNILVGSMLFGLFFGAGNLIFPVFLGQEAGSNLVTASTGFILTAAGLPFLGVLAFGTAKKDTLHQLASLVNEKYATVLTILLYLTIGPLFALPRTGTVAFEVGLAPYVPVSSKPLILAIFTICFFSIALFFSLKESKLLTWVGKVLNPLFLLFLGILIFSAIINPMGSVPQITSDSIYKSAPFIKGFTEGYQTMDALAALAFGSIVIKTIKQFGIKDSKSISWTTLKSGAVSLLGMILIYGSLAWLGATSMQVLPQAANGGAALAQISAHYFGTFGSLFLALIVTIACLKTAIGLITACSDTFKSILPFNLSYRQYAYIFTVFTMFVANIGLTQIISLAVPVLMLLYPLCITLILLGLLTPYIKNYPAIYRYASIGAGIVGIADFLANLPSFISDSSTVQYILSFYEYIFPLFSVGLGWILPMLLGAVFGFCFDSFTKKYKNS